MYHKIGVTYLDVTTLRIHIGEFEDDQNWSKLRTLITKIRPVEIVLNRDSYAGRTINSDKSE